MSNKRLIASLLAFIVLASGLVVIAGGTSAQTSQNNILKVGLVSAGPVVTMNPFYPGGQGAVITSQLVGIMYLSLIQQAPNGTLMPQLAQSWNVNSNATVFTFHLRPNLKWSDGTNLTANDVVYTFNIFNKSSLLDAFNGFEVGALIKNVTALNSTTVQFTLNHSFASFLQYAGLGKVIVPEHIFSKVSNITNFTNQGSPVGDGPFVLNNWTASDTVLRFVPNQYYYGAAPKLGGIDVQILSSSSNIPSLLQTGAIDLAQPAPSQISTLQSQSNLTISTAPGNSIFGTYFDPAGLLMYDNMLYPYNNTTVKQALAYAINRTQIVDLGLNGYGTIGSQGQMPLSLSQWIPSGLPNYTFNPVKARSMLESVGFKNGTNGYLEFANGTAWTPKILDTGGSASSIVAVLVQNLKAAGIDASESIVTTSSLVSALEYGNYDMLLLQTSRPPIPSFVLSVFSSNQTTAVGTQELDYHGWTRWTNATVVSDLQAALLTGNITEQHNLYNQVQQIYAEQLPLITLYYGQSVWAYLNSTVTGWGPAQQGFQFPQSNLLTSLEPVKTAGSGGLPIYVYGIIGAVIIVAIAAAAIGVRRKRGSE